MRVVQEKGQEALVDKLSKNIGFGIGLEFRESACLLSAKNSTLIKSGMAFNVAVGKTSVTWPFKGRGHYYSGISKY